MKSPPSPWFRASLNYEQSLEQSGYYRKKTVNHETRNIILLIVAVLGLLTFATTCHRSNEQILAKIDKERIIQKQEVSKAQHAMNQELWILREAKNSSAMMDQFHVYNSRRK